VTHSTNTFAIAAVYAAAIGTLGAANLPQVTFNKQIAPIIYNNCSSCHRPGEAAPFSLLSYKDVAKRGKLIATVTKSQYMPPWKAEKTSVSFKDERRLKDSEIALIDQWVKDGMPEGDTADAPPAPKFASGWRLGEPDMVVELPAAFHVPADGADIYRNIGLPLGLTEDKWLTAIDMKPTARSVVHHVLYFADPTGKAHTRNEGDQPGFNGMVPGVAPVGLGGWAVGAQPHMQPEGLALKLPKGSDFVIQYHFHPDGKPETEKATIGLYFAKEAPKRTLATVQLPPSFGLFAGLDIPPGDKDYVIKDSFILPVDFDAVSIGAHAHYIATKMKMTATLPSGEVLTLLSIKDWDFAWQDRYYFDHFVALPKGTRLDAEVHWDNTTGNPRNPSDPPIRVTWGEQSKDEMGSVGLQGVPHEEADLKTLQASVRQHTMMMAQRRIQEDPGFLKKLRDLLGPNLPALP
jgi:mono/diheme cytochrome c family protein